MVNGQLVLPQFRGHMTYASTSGKKVSARIVFEVPLSRFNKAARLRFRIGCRNSAIARKEAPRVEPGVTLDFLGFTMYNVPFPSCKVVDTPHEYAKNMIYIYIFIQIL